ncbi:MAG TPA: STAS domain-containing protein [Pseudonocardia sp.]|uniref:STAS domain-containing protein n=1 Tax=Pseudonocardia sp. TaxID=60912 RepID=UPI002B4AB9F6|nr:STAS domain-containing protein [Pseudonocardia sp.]HLU59367.1 STAS domain-containing protein [Pseudonocardia sp.]
MIEPPVEPIRVVVTRAQPSVLLVQVHGELDMATAPCLQEQLLPALERDGHSVLVVDLTRVPFLAAAGIAVLLRLRALARERDVALRIVAAHRPVTRPLSLLGLDSALELLPTREQALGAVPVDHR